MNRPTDARTPGEVLRAARQARGLKLEALAAETKISARLLDALEQDEYHKISGPIYVRSFLRTYAKALGVDPHELVGLYEQQVGRGGASAADEEVWQEERVAVRVVGIPYGRILLRYVLPIMLVLLVAAVGFWLSRRSEPAAQRSAPASSSLLQPEAADSGARVEPAAAVTDSASTAPAESTISPGSARRGGSGAPAGETGGSGM
jgi:cytoskeleton protein RodZ